MNFNANLDIFVNLLLGFIIGIILYRFLICPPILKGPNSRDIIDNVFEHEGKYYRFEPIVCGCLFKNK
jgi:hypothetical protein